MSQILIDSSVWIAFFNGDSTAAILSELIDCNKICINELILAEIIPSLKHKKEGHLIDILSQVQKISLVINWREIIYFQTYNLKKGINNVGISDLIILQNAVNNNVELFTLDKHFSLMSKYFSLKLFDHKKS